MNINFFDNFNFIFIQEYFKTFNWVSIVDGFIVFLIIWQILNFLSKTRAIQIAKGLIFLYIIKAISNHIGLQLVNELFDYLFTLLLLSLPIVFQKEIRMSLELFGRFSPFNEEKHNYNYVLDEIIKTIDDFSSNNTGSLIVIEKTTPLVDHANTGTILEAKVSYELLSSIFKNKSSLHDGAVIIKNGQISAAKCILPLSDNIDKEFRHGTRHRAAIGISEVSDCVVITTSEETGGISIANNGTIEKLDSAEEIRAKVINLLNQERYKSGFKIFNIFSRKN